MNAYNYKIEVQQHSNTTSAQAKIIADINEALLEIEQDLHFLQKIRRLVQLRGRGRSSDINYFDTSVL